MTVWYRWLFVFVMIITWHQSIATTDLYKYIDDEDQMDETEQMYEDGDSDVGNHDESIGQFEVSDDGEINELEMEELEDEIQHELNRESKSCPRDEMDPFDGNQKDFLDLLMATEYVLNCQLTATTETYWKFYILSDGV